VDIAGAKALKERLGSKAADKVPRAPADVPADAPPVYHWTGVPGSPSDFIPDEHEADLAIRGRASLFRRLRFSLR
jgi:hypothetical protein